MILRSARRSGQYLRQSAFTLAEVMVAVGVLGVSFVSLYAGMSTGFALTQVSRENLRATQIMVEKMEGIRLFNWNQIVASNMVPSQFTASYYPDIGESQPYGVSYSGTIVITNLASIGATPARTYDSNLRVVKVRVQWTSGDVPRTRQMSTIVGKDGVQNYVYDR